MSTPDFEAAAHFLDQQAEAAGLRFVFLDGGRVGLAVVGADGVTVGEPMPVRDAMHARFVIGVCQAARAELAALGALLKARQSSRGGFVMSAVTRMSPLLLACRCRVSRPCIVCMRWLRLHRTVTQRRIAWRPRP